MSLFDLLKRYSIKDVKLVAPDIIEDEFHGNATLRFKYKGKEYNNVISKGDGGGDEVEDAFFTMIKSPLLQKYNIPRNVLRECSKSVASTTGLHFIDVLRVLEDNCVHAIHDYDRERNSNNPCVYPDTDKIFIPGEKKKKKQKSDSFISKMQKQMKSVFK